MININSNGLIQLPLVGKLNEFVNMAQIQQANTKKKCYICKRKGHIAKYCKEKECMICHKKHEPICQHKIKQMLVDITNRMNNNFLHDYNYINYKIAVLERKKNRKEEEKCKIQKMQKDMKEKEIKEKYQICKNEEYQCTSKINQFEEIAKTIKNQEFIERVTFTVKKVMKNCQTIVTKKNSKDIYKLKSNQRMYTDNDIDMKATCQYYMNNEIQQQLEKEKNKIENKYMNKNDIVVIAQDSLLYNDCTAYSMEEGFFATKSNLYMTVKCTVSYKIRITPSKEKILKLLANKIFKGKVTCRTNANKYVIKADNQAPKNASIKNNLKDYYKLKNYYEILFKKIELEGLLESKCTQLMHINKQINESRKELQNTKKMIINEKKMKKKVLYEKLRKELKISELNNKLENTKSKIAQAKNIAESKIKQEFRLNHAEIEANMRRQQQLLSQNISKKREIIQRQRAIIKKNKESEYYFDDNDAGESHCHYDGDSD